MAKRNQYSFSKRQRELKKKKKQEDKRLRKQDKKEGAEGDDMEFDAADYPLESNFPDSESE